MRAPVLFQVEMNLVRNMVKVLSRCTIFKLLHALIMNSFARICVILGMGQMFV